jgi:predicted NAD/FAD-dependent oxidoreductase
VNPEYQIMRNTILKTIAAVIVAPVLALLIAFILTSLEGEYRVKTREEMIGWLATAVLYWLFFTGRLAWVFRRVGQREG